MGRVKLFLRSVRSNLLALPVFGVWLILFMFPICLLVAYSMGTTDLDTFHEYWGWTASNYQEFASSTYIGPVLNSVLIAVTTTIACLIIGFPVAYFISTRGPRMQKLLLLAVLVPFWVSFVIRAYAWIMILQNDGPLNRFLNFIGLVPGSLDMLYTPQSILIVMIYGYLPFMILPLYVAMTRIEPEVYDAAADLGAGKFRVLRKVIIPLAKPGIYSGIIIAGIPAIGEYTIPAILGGNKTLLLGNVIANLFQLEGDYSAGSAFAIIMTVAVLLVIILLRKHAGNIS